MANVCKTAIHYSEQSANFCRDAAERKTKTPHIVQPHEALLGGYEGSRVTSWKVRELEGCVSAAPFSADIDVALACAGALTRIRGDRYEARMVRWHLFSPNEYIIQKSLPKLTIK